MWYGTGTIQVAANGTTATGTGTQFLGNVRVGDGIAIQGSASLHEVTGVTSNTQLTFSPPYAGTAGSGKAFRIVPVLGYDKDLSDAFNALRLQFGDQLSNLQPWATATTLPEARTAFGFGATGSALADAATPAAARTHLGIAQNNTTATAAPTRTDDSTKGYGPLSEWVVPSAGEVWQCVSAAAGAAVWQRPAAMVRNDSVDPLVIGLRRPTNASLPHQWQRIREDGSLFTDDARVYFANHPTYSGIHTVTIDGQYMVHVPKFWIKTVDLPSGGIEYYISPHPKPGFVVHHAHTEFGDELNQFWIGAYHASEDAVNAGMLASQPNVLPRVSLSGVTAITQMKARNRDGIAGFGSMTWAQICAVKLLILIECGSPDVRTLIGEGWSASTAGEIKPTGTSSANWRGIYDVWGLVHTLADGIEIVGPRVWMRGPDGEMVDTGHDVPASGYINTTAGGDLAWAFLPAATGGSTTGYLSYQWANNDTTTAVRHGGAFNNASAPVGLCSFNGSNSLANAYSASGFRLAKV